MFGEPDTCIEIGFKSCEGHTPGNGPLSLFLAYAAESMWDTQQTMTLFLYAFTPRICSREHVGHTPGNGPVSLFLLTPHRNILLKLLSKFMGPYL